MEKNLKSLLVHLAKENGSRTKKRKPKLAKLNLNRKNKQPVQTEKNNNNKKKSFVRKRK